MKGNENIRWCFAFAQIVDCCHITAYVLQLLTSNKRYLRCMQLEVNNLMSPGRNWFEPNGSGLSQVHMHVLALNSWLGLGRFVLVYWGERLVLLWDEEVGSSHTSGSSVSAPLPTTPTHPPTAAAQPPTHCTDWSQVGAAARFGHQHHQYRLAPSSGSPSLGPADRCNWLWHPIHSQHLPNPIQFANTACLM